MRLGKALSQLQPFLCHWARFKYPTDISFQQTQNRLAPASVAAAPEKEGTNLQHPNMRSSLPPPGQPLEKMNSAHIARKHIPTVTIIQFFIYESKVQEHAHETCDVFISSSSCQNEPEMSLSPKQYA